VVDDQYIGGPFSRQISMYLAKHVGGWSTTRIYNGHHHSTVLHAIAKVERLRQTDESIDAPIDVITAAVSPAVNGHEISFQTKEKAVLIEAIAAQVLDRVLQLRRSDHRALVGTDPAQR
jgi:hypothetical protein